MMDSEGLEIIILPEQPISLWLSCWMCFAVRVAMTFKWWTISQWSKLKQNSHSQKGTHINEKSQKCFNKFIFLALPVAGFVQIFAVAAASPHVGSLAVSVDILAAAQRFLFVLAPPFRHGWRLGGQEKKSWFRKCQLITELFSRHFFSCFILDLRPIATLLHLV